jgi:hypothetical protein
MFVELQDTVYIVRGTFSPTTGALVAADSTPSAVWYEDGSTGLTTGITVTSNFDGVTGSYLIAIACTTANGFEAGKRYSIVMFATIEGVDQMAEIANFILMRQNQLPGALPVDVHGISGDSTAADNMEAMYDGTGYTNSNGPAKQSQLPSALVSGRVDASVGAYQSGLTPLQPTVSGRTLDVSAGGEAGLDWANIGSPTTSVNLSGTTVKDATDVNTDTDTLLARLTSLRASYLDNLSAGAVALASSLTIAAGDITTLLGRLTSTRAGYLDNLSGGAVALASALATAQSAITAIKTVTDQFVFTVANKVDATADVAIDGESLDATFLALLGVVRRNTAQAGGTATNIILDASASAVDDSYDGMVVYIYDGTGAGQERTALPGYDGTSKALPIDRAWGTNPDATSKFVIFSGKHSPYGAAKISDDTLIDGTLSRVVCARIINAVMFGTVTGFEDGVLEFTSPDGTKTRLTVVTDDDGRETITVGDTTR